MYPREVKLNSTLLALSPIWWGMGREGELRTEPEFLCLVGWSRTVVLVKGERRGEERRGGGVEKTDH
jgi:hypothetical protein